jgi:hypothetical protein
MKKRFENKFIFFVIPLALLAGWSMLFATKEQKDTVLPVLMALLMIALLLNFRRTEQINLVITKQKDELNEQKKIIEAKNKELEEKNKDILDSLRYAKRIQTSLLPTQKYIARILSKRQNETGAE